MKNLYRNSAITLVASLVIVLAWASPRLRSDNDSINPNIIPELRLAGEMGFEAPFLELLTWPVLRVDYINTDTGEAKVGAYSWFNWKIGNVTIHDCRFGKSGIVNKNFGCFGGSNTYYFFDRQTK